MKASRLCSFAVDSVLFETISFFLFHRYEKPVIAQIYKMNLEGTGKFFAQRYPIIRRDK